jgi:hypothetical protein
MQNEKVEIELQSEITPEIILKARRTKIIKIFDVKVGNSKSRSEEQKKHAKDKIKKFVQENEDQLLVFTDGSVTKIDHSVTNNAAGKGGCGGVIVNPSGDNRKFSKPVGRLVDNVETEVAGIVEGFEEALKLLREQ